MRYAEHSNAPDDAARAIDEGIGAFNDRAAPLHEVRALSVVARDENGAVIGGAIGRTWGRACELQQLWVDDRLRGKRVGRELMTRFEAAAAARGCTEFYLETFNFQARGFYEKLGYTVAYTLDALPHGIERYLMRKRVTTTTQPAS